jgi:hypothetical protein
MTSLDDVFEQMRLFQQALREFNEEVSASAGSLQRTHEQASAVWRDEAAVRYERTYAPLQESLNSYLRVEAPRLERFIETKVQQLERYLNGA